MRVPEEQQYREQADQFIVSGLFNSGFSLALMRKDINIATDLAKERGDRHAAGRSPAQVMDGPRKRN